MSKLSINGMNMHYETHGTGYPLILLHGGLNANAAWKACVPSLAKHFQVILPDNRGSGRSDNPAGHLTYHMMADDVAALIKDLQLDKPFVGGWSDGGQIALELGMHHPNVTAGLILGATWVRFDEQYLNFASLLGFNGPGDVDLEQFHTLLRSVNMLDTYVAQHPGGLAQLNTIVKQLSVLWMTDLNYQPADLAKISVPSLIVLGDRDQAISIDQAVHLYHQITDAELAIVPNAAHNLPGTDPEKFTAVIIEFMQRRMFS